MEATRFLKVALNSVQTVSRYHSNTLVSSPCVSSSILITSAPRSASNIVAVGPASTLVRSTILIPFSGGAIPWPVLARLAERFLASNRIVVRVSARSMVRSTIKQKKAEGKLVRDD